MTAIQVRKTAEEPGATSLAVTVPVEQVQEAEARATSAYQRRARLPGFRKGKAPAALVKRQFADDIRQQTLEELIRESWKAALAQEALKPIADPHIHNLKWDAGTPVTFEFHVEVKPELTLERIGKFHLKRTAPTVTEDRVLAQLNELREQKAPWTPVAADKPKPKDLVQVTIATGVHGARSEEHTSELQSHSDLVCRLLLEKKKHKYTAMALLHRLAVYVFDAPEAPELYPLSLHDALPI